jgi:hypothetical protein
VKKEYTDYGGSARESRVTAEIELLSSNSENVCELWNGREIVRLAGQPKILGCVFTEDETGFCVGDLNEALTKQWMINKENKETQRFTLSVLFTDAGSYPAPNLALNAGRTASEFEKWTFAIIALTLQTVAVIVPAVSTYHWHWNKGSKYAQEYAYPCYLAGTLAVGFGVSLCSHAIDLATEFEIIPFGKRRIGPIFHIQLPCTIGDQDFPTALIMNNNSNHGIRISRLRRVKREVRQVEPLL